MSSYNLFPLRNENRPIQIDKIIKVKKSSKFYNL
jgi:hypothetical protein